MERTRTVPLFPLRGVVLYPSMSIELHVFEPRYRALLADVLDGAGCFGVPLLHPGYSEVFETAPPIEPVFGVGRVVQYEQHQDGTADVRILGERRVRLLEELPLDVYRRAVVRELPEGDWTGPEAERLRALVADGLAQRLPPPARQQIGEVVRDPERGFRPIMYLVANLVLPTPIARQALLAIDDPEQLGQAILDAIAEGPPVEEQPDEGQDDEK